MARRSDHTREELMTLAIQAGGALIDERGYAKFSARAVAANIGYTVGTLYHVFGTLDDFILRINAATLDEMGGFIMASRDGSLKESAAIKQLAACYLEFAHTHYHRWNALFEHHLPPDMPLPEWYAEKIRALFAVVEIPLLPMVGGNRKQAAHAAKTIWAGIHGICALGLTGKLEIVGAEPIQALMDSLIDHYATGLLQSAKAAE